MTRLRKMMLEELERRSYAQTRFRPFSPSRVDVGGPKGGNGAHGNREMVFVQHRAGLDFGANRMRYSFAIR
jgi:hypothetical protein